MNMSIFNKLFNHLTDFKYDYELRRLLRENKKNHDSIFTSKSQIRSKIDALKTSIAGHVNTIKKVVDARDEVYAHKDPNPSVELIKHEELSQLVSLCSDVTNTLLFNFLYKKWMFTETKDWDINYPLFYASAYYKLDKERKIK